jgi:hypothetical protein
MKGDEERVEKIAEIYFNLVHVPLTFPSPLFSSPSIPNITLLVGYLNGEV